ncbi:MAG: hypothetical protein PHR83_02910 [Paludibacter sp.]|nr:hypothetical protein [Paludibacter sp.]
MCAIITFFACQKEPIVNEKPIASAHFEFNGLSFVAGGKTLDSTAITPIVDVNCNYITQMPFAFGQLNSTQVTFDPNHQWWGETDLGVIVTTKLAREKEIKTMLKPQIWVRNSYPAAFNLTTEVEWTAWEKNYSTYILHFAHLADSLDIEMFCIGTELKMVVEKRPQYWSNLIDTIRTFYGGKLIYAANWDDYQQVPFWNKLDYIGIDAYFPLSNENTPTVASLVSSWQKEMNEIDQYRLSKNKSVIFTEIGYKSVDQCAKEPWNPISTIVNQQSQSNALQAFFQTFADKPWFKGAFLWKWYPQHTNAGGINNTDYTPQNKSAQEIIKIAFKTK